MQIQSEVSQKASLPTGPGGNIIENGSPADVHVSLTKDGVERHIFFYGAPGWRDRGQLAHRSKVRALGEDTRGLQVLPTNSFLRGVFAHVTSIAAQS